ncbi:MAG: hypothetical protein JST00_12495 [Deltaproteobacteria bacterium]|nr:hypothetical protein [Deltaproteobacteria bacterium]
MSDAPSRVTASARAPLRTLAPPLLLLALTAPLVALNVAIEPSTGDRPVRLAPWVESLEGIAIVAMLATIALVVARGVQARQGARAIALRGCVQSALVLFVALPALLLSRGGGLLGDTHVRSYEGPNGQSAHVYATGFLDGCRHAVYLARSGRLSMDRVDVTRGCAEPTIRWDEAGNLVVSAR